MNNLLLFIKAQHRHCAPRVEVLWRFWRCFPTPRQPRSAEKSPHCARRLLWCCLKERGMHSSRHSNARGEAASRAGQTPQVVNALKRTVCVRVSQGVRARGCRVCVDSWLKGLHSLYLHFFLSWSSLLLALLLFSTPLSTGRQRSRGVAWNDFLLPSLRKEPQSFCFWCF